MQACANLLAVPLHAIRAMRFDQRGASARGQIFMPKHALKRSV